MCLEIFNYLYSVIVNKFVEINSSYFGILIVNIHIIIASK